MKKKLQKMFLGAMLAGLMVVPQAASADDYPDRPEDRPEISVAVNGKVVKFPDQPPVVDTKANRVLVPVRFPAETLGASVGWQQAEKQVTIDQQAKDKLPEAHLILTLNQKAVKVNGEEKQMDTVPVIKKNRTLVPLRFISEYLGAEVKWWQASSTAHVFTLGQSEEEQKRIMEQVANELKKTQPYTEVVKWTQSNGKVWDNTLHHNCTLPLDMGQTRVLRIEKVKYYGLDFVKLTQTGTEYITLQEDTLQNWDHHPVGWGSGTVGGSCARPNGDGTYSLYYEINKNWDPAKPDKWLLSYDCTESFEIDNPFKD